MTTFRNPVTGQTEEVSDLIWLWTLLFGLFYFMYRGVWRHVLIQLGVTILACAAFGPAGLLFTGIMWLIYAFMAQSVIEGDLARRGYRPSSGGTTPDSSPAAPPRATRACPFCAEEILAAAVKCKHCGSEVEPVVEPTRQRATGIGANHPVPQRPPSS